MIRTRLRAGRTKSPYPASAIRSIRCALVICLAIMVPFDVHASGDQPSWQISKISGLVRYIVHGTTVYGHQFGFVKNTGRCNVDILWLTWYSDDPEVMKLVGSEITFFIDVDGTTSKITADLVNTSTRIPFLTVVLFTNFTADLDFLSLLNRGREISITISGDARNFFDVPSDHFSIMGFETARREARKACQDRWG